MEKTKFDLSELREEISWIEYDAEKINLLILNMAAHDRNTALFSDMVGDYVAKIIENLKTIESVLKREVEKNG